VADHYSADQHHLHKNILRLSNRPWADVDSMTEGLVQRWNDAVSANDTVWVLGDFSLSLAALGIVARLNGDKVLVAGNHDPCWDHHSKGSGGADMLNRYLRAGFADVYTSGVVRGHVIDGVEVVLSHLPYHGDYPHDSRYADLRPVDTGLPIVCGHVHTTWRDLYGGDGRVHRNQINVGVDVWDFCPVPASQVARLLRIL
jgi:calcineurin-like phosphoesterase family protein